MLDLIYKDWLKQKYQIYNLQQLTSYINNLISLAETLGFYQLQKDLQQLSTTLKDSRLCLRCSRAYHRNDAFL